MDIKKGLVFRVVSEEYEYDVRIESIDRTKCEDGPPLYLHLNCEVIACTRITESGRKLYDEAEENSAAESRQEMEEL